MLAVAQTFVPSFDFHKALRVFLIVAMLTVGSLRVTRCQETDEDAGTIASDQHGRMYGEDK